ncbi:hypothetical protein FS837_006517, partial [Tulasnella sp. UAMH 9824]
MQTDSTTAQNKGRIEVAAIGQSNTGMSLQPTQDPEPVERTAMTTSAPEPDWNGDDNQGNKDGPAPKNGLKEKRKRGASDPKVSEPDPGAGEKGKKSKSKRRKGQLKAEILNQKRLALEGKIAHLSAERAKLDGQHKDAQKRLEEAKARASAHRKEVQSTPLPVMHIDGMANGVGMSRPGQAEFESASTKSVIMTDVDFDDPNFGESLYESDEDQIPGCKQPSVAVIPETSRKRLPRAAPSTEHLRHTKSQRVVLESHTTTAGSSQSSSLPAKKAPKAVKKLSTTVKAIPSSSPLPPLIPPQMAPSSSVPTPNNSITASQPENTFLLQHQQAQTPPLLCLEWPKSVPPGAVNTPRMPKWWKAVQQQAEKNPTWIGSCQFCKICGDGGSSLGSVPCVRCAHCSIIYCVSDQNGRPENKGCIDVPSFARSWLCPSCLKDCASGMIKDATTLELASSEMNTGYTMRHPELSGAPSIPRTPFLFLEIQCLKDETRKPFSVGHQFLDLIKHAYGPHATIQVLHCSFDVASLCKPDTEQSQIEAITFLSAQKRCNVLITLDAHTFGDDGNVNYADQLGAPIPM